jgi:uncharacterized membrane protein YvlD (DUF360 family)
MKNILEILNDIAFILFRLICVPILFFIFYTLGLFHIVLNKCVDKVVKATEFFIKDDDSN